jgi:drug/metabolite transporter (DMT)-like permease
MALSSSTSVARTETSPRLSRSQIGWIAMSITVLIWAGFSVSLRAISHSTLSSADVALIRFLVPAIALLPFVRARLPALKAMQPLHALMIVIGAGLPFFLIAAAGGRLTSAAHVSVLVAGTVPLSVALLALVCWREPIQSSRRLGLLLIVAGVLLMVAGLGAMQLPMLQGVALLLIASLLWGMYTLALRKTTIDPVGTLMLITYPAVCGIVILMATGAMESHLAQANFNEIGWFVLVQGICVGILSPLAYAAAIRCLGSVRSSTIGALAPVIAALIAIPVLHEIPTVLSVAGILAVTTGVVLTNRHAKGRA